MNAGFGNYKKTRGNLLGLGARLIKVEEPGVGDPMRHIPPLVDGIGAAIAQVKPKSMDVKVYEVAREVPLPR